MFLKIRGGTIQVFMIFNGYMSVDLFSFAFHQLIKFSILIETKKITCVIRFVINELF